ncbi:MAG: methylenetetrahydrofolate dehydrogenase [Microgenomates group bacterium GW2011_GWA1_48_10]|uniref:Bifunctional protein FolD n=1 Tax=Candidatus Gottesmanbacteria bacterium RIFCSPHIGHO2_01_FULL_47_48 TaxID=1798381 RepID=A0A1F6A2S1_9BACT|nr:MAG: methylenetetrahydrofolate dehydrogenase [Microgenomates group bacterium GW2011_GWA1_48_10]OGG18971.1 MAG: hypothetical protein A2721_02420 [Candidatus Gottesmanbacteria bacterium RIFCSPHIGHO2_01_FULL_47_48]
MIIDGKAIAAKRLEELRLKVEGLRIKPKLVAILVGEDPASVMYVNMKKKRAEEVGIVSEIVELPSKVSVTKATQLINRLNADQVVTGILVQLPFPKDSPVFGHEREILDAIDPVKDVDSLTSVNMGLLALGQPRYYPATVKAVLVVLEEALNMGDLKLNKNHAVVYDLFGKSRTVLGGFRAVVVGRSEIVGKPAVMALINLGATVTVGNSRTTDLAEIAREADILISATGVAHLVKADMVKKGAIVIDVGIDRQSTGLPDYRTTDKNRVGGGRSTVDRVVGDVDFESVSKVAGAISPVPGGVGPLTVSSLLENVVLAGRRD